jgi:hypothetical protein
MLITYVPDHTVDEFTATAHGLHSGDGPLRLDNIGGAVPTGLSLGVDYYFLRVSANVGAFATSRANAITGIRETFSSNGTGTQMINIGLPFKAPRVAAPGIQVFSADQNSMWQAITDGQLASRPQIIGAASGAGAADWVANGVQFGAIRATVASPGAWCIPIPVGLGDILTKVDIRCQHSVATSSAIQVLLYSSDTGSTTVQTINSAASTAVQTLTTGTIEIPIDDGRQWGIVTGSMSGGAMNRDIMWVRYYVRHRPFMAFP